MKRITLIAIVSLLSLGVCLALANPQVEKVRTEIVEIVIAPSFEAVCFAQVDALASDVFAFDGSDDLAPGEDIPVLVTGKPSGVTVAVRGPPKDYSKAFG